MSEGYNTVDHKVKGRAAGYMTVVECGSRRAIVAHTDWKDVTCKRCLAKKPVVKAS